MNPQRETPKLCRKQREDGGMIKTRDELQWYLKCDRIAMQKKSKARPWNDTYYFLWVLRHYEYWSNQKGFLGRVLALLWHIRYKKISMKCGFTIPINIIGPGLCLPHYGTIVISSYARIGCNCKIHAGVNIGATNGNNEAKIIGDNVYIGPGAKLVGAGYIASRVVIGANAVVTGDVSEEGITVAGVPARKISDKDSSLHLINATEIAREKVDE